jgi:DNA-binding NtrC family response regulator
MREMDDAPRTPAQPATILLVEDEEAVRKIAARTLSEEKYDVLEAGSAEEALLRCQSFGGRIDLVVTDVIMPGMSGLDLAENLQTERADAKVLFMSGYLEARNSDAEKLEKGEFLQKPFRPQTLLAKVHELLDDNHRPRHRF